MHYSTDWYIHALLCKSSGKQERAHTNSNSEGSHLMWEIRQSRRQTSGHDGHLINCLEGMDDTLHGTRDDLRSFRGRAGLPPFCEDFHRLLLLCCGVCCLLFVFVWFLSSASGEKTPASNSRFTLFAFAHLRVDRPRPVLARQCRKKKKKKGV